MLDKLKNKQELIVTSSSSSTTAASSALNGNTQPNHQQTLSISYDSYPVQTDANKQTKYSDSNNLNIKLNSTNKNIPNQITIGDNNNNNKHIYVNDKNNNLSLDLENRQAFPLKSTPSTNNNNNNNSNTYSTNNSKVYDSTVSKKTLSVSSSNSISQNTTSMSTIVNNTSLSNESNNKKADENNNNNNNKTIKNSSSNSIVDNSSSNNNNNNKNVNNQNGVIITNQVQPVTRYTTQSDIKNKINENKNDKSKFIPIIDTDGVKYKFKSDETIGGKSDISHGRSSKFNCIKCLNCSIM